jgi:hypothetical protein
MAIVFTQDAQGGFVAGDTETRLTAYAYPSSPYANESRARPEDTAAKMIKGEAWRKDHQSRTFLGAPSLREYDGRYWEILEGRETVSPFAPEVQAFLKAQE